MQVYFYANLRQIVGGKTARFDLPGQVRLSSVMAAVVERYPALHDLLFTESGVLRQQVHLFVNGRDVLYLPEGFETTLLAEDRLDIFPPVGGG